MSELFDKSKQLYGRTRITSNLRFSNDAVSDIATAKEILVNSLTTHKKNVDEINKLWGIYCNDHNWWNKTKKQRDDIDNKANIDDAWSYTRTLNGYIFGKPVKYIARENKQEQVEKFSQLLDFCSNHTATISQATTASVTGLGYKLVLPSDTLLDEDGVPFMIKTDTIYPQLAFVVYTDEAIPRKLMGVLIGEHTDDDGNKVNKYICWTNNFQIIFIEDETGYKVLPQEVIIGKSKQIFNAYPIVSGRIPLVEYERNSLRKGDWEVVTDLMEFKNKLISGRVDDIDQIIDYVMVLMNCEFETKEDKENVKDDRLISLKVIDAMVKPSVEILKNPLDQNGVQVLMDYIDRSIQQIVGVPTRDERSGGGQDTGSAVEYRNGYRDLENNAGIIYPAFEKAEIEFLNVCLAIAKNSNNSDLGDLRSKDIRLKPSRAMHDDITASANAFSVCVNAGMDNETALLVSKIVSDPAETAKNMREAKEKGELFIQSNETSQRNNNNNTDSATNKNVTEEIKEVDISEEQ